MAQVPYNPIPNQSPSTGSLGRQDASAATPSAFGAGLSEGLHDIGDNLVKQGDMLAAHAVTFQNIQNKAWSDNAYVDQMNKANTLLFGDGKTPGFMDLQGKAAVDAFPTVRGKLADMREQIAEAAPNQAASLLFDADSRRLVANQLSTMSSHAAQQNRQYLSDTHDGLVTGAQANAVVNYKDSGATNNAINVIQQANAQEAVIQGKPPEWLTNKNFIDTSKLHADIAKRLAVDNPFAGQDYYNTHSKDMTAADQVQLGEYFHSVTQPAAAWNIASNVMAGGRPVPVKDFDDAIVNIGEHGKLGAVNTKSGAAGPGQVTPATAMEVAKKLGIEYDPEKLANDSNYNTAIRTGYEQQLLQRFGGNQTLAAAAYNAGPGIVNDWIYGTNNTGKNAQGLRIGNPVTGEVSNEQFIEQIPFAETKAYATRINEALGKSSGVTMTSYDPRDHLDDLLAAGNTSAQYAAPGQPLLAKAVEANIRSQVGLTHEIVLAQRTDSNNRLMSAAMGFSPTGQSAQKPRSWGEFTTLNPDWQSDWVKMTPSQQEHIVNVVAANGSGKSIAPNQENMAQYATLVGKSISDPKDFSTEDLSKYNLPYSYKLNLIKKQAEVANKPQPNEDITHALGVANQIGLKDASLSPDQHNLFVGRLSSEIDTFNQVHGRKPSDSDLMKITQQLLLSQKTGLLSSTRNFEQNQEIPSDERAAIVESHIKHFGSAPNEGQIDYWYKRQHAGP